MQIPSQEEDRNGQRYTGAMYRRYLVLPERVTFIRSHYLDAWPFFQAVRLRETGSMTGDIKPGRYLARILVYRWREIVSISIVVTNPTTLHL